MGTEHRVIPPLKVDLSQFSDELFEAYGKVIASGVLVLGEYTRAAEEAFASDHNKKYGIAVNSDTAALESVLQFIDIKGQFVLLPQTAFFGVVHVVLRLGGIPLLLDSDVDNGIFPKTSRWEMAVEKYKPKVALLVYSAGMAGEDVIGTINMLAEKGVYSVEDCAHVHGSKYSNGDLVGSAGDFATWSSYATKIIHSGEGGMIATSIDAADDFMKKYRNYGRKIVDAAFTESASPLGYNWRMTEMQAATLFIMWKHLDKLIQQRKEVADVYSEYFCPAWPRDFPAGTTAPLEPYELAPRLGKKNYYRYTVMVPGLTYLGNKKLYAELARLNPSVKLQEKSNHLPISLHKALAPHSIAAEPFDGARRYSLEHLCMPIYPTLSKIDARYIAESVRYLISERL